MKSAFIAALGVRKLFLFEFHFINSRSMSMYTCVFAHICVTNVPLEWNETLLVTVPMVLFL